MFSLTVLLRVPQHTQRQRTTMLPLPQRTRYNPLNSIDCGLVPTSLQIGTWKVLLSIFHLLWVFGDLFKDFFFQEDSKGAYVNFLHWLVHFEAARISTFPYCPLSKIFVYFFQSRLLFGIFLLANLCSRDWFSCDCTLYVFWLFILYPCILSNNLFSFLSMQICVSFQKKSQKGRERD